MKILHNFVSGLSDGSDATKVRASNWNADHDFILDSTSSYVWDDFLGGGDQVSGRISNLGWRISVIAGTIPAPVFQNGVYPNIGIEQISTDTATPVAGEGLLLLIDQDNAGPMGNLGGNTNWEEHWIFRMNSTANIRFRIGLFPAGSGSVEPSSGIWVRFDTNAGFADTNFRYICRSASTDTNVDSTIAGDTAFHRIRIRSLTSGNIKFQLYSASGVAQGSEQTISTNVPTTNMSPGVCLVSDTTAAKTADLDFFSFRYTGLAR